MADVSTLDVRLHGEPIGSLTNVGGDRTVLAFTDDYIDDRDRPVLSLGFKDRLGELMTDFRPTRTRLLPFFSNLLPEGHLRSYLAERAGVNPVREFFLLWALGPDLPGAVTIAPSDGEAWLPAAGQDSANPRREDSRPTGTLRFSLAGVQLKFSAVKEATGGMTIPAEGVGGSWIVKLPSSRFPSVPENEFSMLSLARLVGIDVPRIQLLDLDAIGNLPEGLGAIAGQALAIERFDRRPDGGRVHIEDFAQVFGVYPEDKYKKASLRNIASVLAAEGSQADIAELTRRLTFSMLIGNADMHLKNWSLIYADRRSATLSPAYDLLSTVAYLPDRNAALTVSRSKRFDDFSTDELEHLAAKARLPATLVLQSARETVALFHQHWRAEKANLPLPSSIVGAIDDHVASVPIAGD